MIGVRPRIDEQPHLFALRGAHVVAVAVQHAGVGDHPVERPGSRVLLHHPVGDGNGDPAGQGDRVDRRGGCRRAGARGVPRRWVFAFLWCVCRSAAAPTAKVPEYIPAAAQKTAAIDGRLAVPGSSGGASGVSASPRHGRLYRPTPAVNWTVGDRIASTPMPHLVAAPDKFRAPPPRRRWRRPWAMRRARRPDGPPTRSPCPTAGKASSRRSGARRSTPRCPDHWACPVEAEWRSAGPPWRRPRARPR